MRAEDSIPSGVAALLRSHVASFEQLQLLLYLVSHPGPHEPAALEDELGLPASLVEEAVADLLRASLIEAVDGNRAFRYAAKTPELRQAVHDLALHYADRPMDILKLMSANAVDRVRSAAIHAFADAFLLRKRKDG